MSDSTVRPRSKLLAYSVVLILPILAVIAGVVVWVPLKTCPDFGHGQLHDHPRSSELKGDFCQVCGGSLGSPLRRITVWHWGRDYYTHTWQLKRLLQRREEEELREREQRQKTGKDRRY